MLNLICLFDRQEPFAGNNIEDAPGEYDEHHGNVAGGDIRPRQQGQQRVPLAGGNHENVHRHLRGEIGGARNGLQRNALPMRPTRTVRTDQTRQHGRRLKYQDLVEMTKLGAEDLLSQMNIRVTLCLLL